MDEDDDCWLRGGCYCEVMFVYEDDGDELRSHRGAKKRAGYLAKLPAFLKSQRSKPSDGHSSPRPGANVATLG